MNTRKLSGMVAFATVLAVTLGSCRKNSDKPEDFVSHKDVIIGCKTGQPITVGIDPIKGPEFNFTKGIGSTVLTGPSCLNGRKDLYYTAGSDKMLDEIEVSTGTVKRSFQTPNHILFVHYRAADNSLIYAVPSGQNNQYSLFRLDLGSGNSSPLFTFTLTYGMGARTSFIRGNAVYYLSGAAELMRLDLGAQSLSTVKKLAKVTNSLIYDGVLDKVFYMASLNNTDFSICSYDFSTNSDAVLKNYPDIRNYLMGSTTYNPANNNYYFYNSSGERVTINVITLNKITEKVKFPLINTEIVDCLVKQKDVDQG